MTLVFRVLKPIEKPWKIFVHFDSQKRFQADHAPIAGHCDTNQWKVGDYVVDRFAVVAGDSSHPKSRYSVYVGFFRGSAGNWNNLPVTTGNHDGNNRAKIGEIRLK